MKTPCVETRQRQFTYVLQTIRDALNRNHFQVILLCLVLFFGGYLRTVGLTWGLNTGYGAGKMFHTDERLTIQGVFQLDLLAGNLRAPTAYFEGTFNYYLWAIPVAAINLSRQPGQEPLKLKDKAHVAQILFWGRVMSVAFDVLAILVVFLAAKEATKAFYPSLLGALLYAIIPIQVIYAHYMRVHLLSNLLCAIVLWLSVRLSKTPTRWLCFIVGGVSGLGAATRFPVGIIVTIPCLYLLLKPAANRSTWLKDMRVAIWNFISGPVWWIALGFLCGLFIGHPMLFLDPTSVLMAISKDTFRFVPSNAFSVMELFDLSRVWRYLSVLIPYGLYPLLWIVAYGAVLYLCFRRSLYHLSLPILFFSLLYLYPMAKGYAIPQFARAAMLLSPGICVLSGLCAYDIFIKQKTRVWILVCLAGIVAFVFIPSIIFNWTYVSAMTRPDVRTIVQDELKTMIGSSPAVIGVGRYGGHEWTARPAVESLRSDTVTVRVQGPAEQADFFLLGRRGAIDSRNLEADIRSVEEVGKFKFLKVYSAPPKLFGREVDLVGFPSDMTYPFPTILVFRAAKVESSP